MNQSLGHCWNGSPSKLRLMLFSVSVPHDWYWVSDLMGMLLGIVYPMAVSPGVGSARAGSG